MIRVAFGKMAVTACLGKTRIVTRAETLLR
jgi:hypothetical protein